MTWLAPSWWSLRLEPWHCDHRVVQAVLRGVEAAQNKICQQLGLQHCRRYFAAGTCNDNWLAVSLSVLTGLLTLLVFSCMLKWYTTKRGGKLVAEAAAAAADLRRSHPEQYPPASHSWQRISGRQLAQPLLCAVCFEPIQPENDGKTVNACDVCGEVAHEGCARHVPHDCKPVSMQAEELVHLWRPCGVTMSAQDEDGEAAVQNCHYCRQLCDADMFCSEPIWSCVYCQAVAHVRCYHHYHPQPDREVVKKKSSRRKSVSRKDASHAGTTGASTVDSTAGADTGETANKTAGNSSVPIAASASSIAPASHSSEAATQANGIDTVPPLPNSLPPLRITREAFMEHLSDAGESDVDTPASVHQPNGLPNGDMHPPMTPQALQSRINPVSHPLGARHPVARKLGASHRTGSLGRLMTALSAMVTDVAEGPGTAEAATASQAAVRLAAAAADQPQGSSLAQLDRCSMGPHWRLVLPPTAFREIPGVTWSARAKALLPSRNKDKKGRRGSRSLQKQPSGHSWWGPKETPWQNYSLGDIPVGAKPVLVFVNTKSGPQLGRELRRKFLRILNPLQVVELPRERPDRALQLFADVPNLRLLVIGGDGTVGWVLSCLDSLQAARQKQSEDSGGSPNAWLPPPIAIIPLGTGNDLARTLNWGGGMSAYQLASVDQLLASLEQSAVTLLDRWDVRITPQAQQAVQRESKDGGSSAASASSAIRSTIVSAVAPSQQATCKAMNNYLGIGIDAKVALEFHQMRDQYPEWFHSQFGNKLWYTGVGAKDVFAHASLHLPRRIKVECDGEEVALPADTEGILLLNIPSYMGGVDLWASGRSVAGASDTAQQSICDQRLELVAVQGSWHLGQLQVGLSRARRLTRCSYARITLLDTMPMQVDGEPWKQPAAVLEIGFKGAALMLRKLKSAPLARMAGAVAEALDACQTKGLITAGQRHALTTELAARLQPIL